MPASKLFEYPTGSYLMLRLDYLLICGDDELEAEILRIVEMYVEKERMNLFQKQVNAGKSAEEVIEIAKDLWTSISHRLFLDDLYHMVKSENTLKRAIKSLVDKKFLIMRITHGKHEATLYRLNIDAIEAEFGTIKRIGVKEYRKLMVSKADAIKKRSHQKLIEGEGKELIPSGGSRVSTTDTPSNRDYENTLGERDSSVPPPSPSPSPAPPDSLSQDDVTIDTFPDEQEEEGPSTDKRPTLHLVPPQPEEQIITPLLPARWDTNTCLQLFRKWRDGHNLIADEDIRKANKYAAQLIAEHYTRADVIDTRTYMVEKHIYWSKRSVEVWDVAKAIHEILPIIKKQRETQPQNGTGGHGETAVKYAELRRKYAAPTGGS